MSGNRHGHTDNRNKVINVSVGNPYIRGNTQEEKIKTYNKLQLRNLSKKPYNKELSKRMYKAFETDYIKNKK